MLRAQLQSLSTLAVAAKHFQESQEAQSGVGLQIQFKSQPNVELAFQSLADERKKIELLSVHEVGQYTYANVFVPDGALSRFDGYVSDYVAYKKGNAGQALDHAPLLNSIESISATDVKALWTDPPSEYPSDPALQFWWEVWLPVREGRAAVIADFRKFAQFLGCEVGGHYFEFPERTVTLLFASEGQLSSAIPLLNCIAELRRAKETASFFDEMTVEDQRGWAADLLARTTCIPPDRDTPYVCLLDTGVTRGHPLIQPLIDAGDLHTVDPDGQVHDAANHGTGLAGLAAYGDMTEILANSNPVFVRHRLESVRLLEKRGANASSDGRENEQRLHAYLFGEAVSRPEIDQPNRKRIFCSAVTAADDRDRGRPSSWSAAVDSLAADVDGDGEFPRLFVLSAGNTVDAGAWQEYPHSLSTSLVRDPGQSWNAVTVGACTYKCNTLESSYSPVANPGGLSPYTSTSAAWQSSWPLKPEIVLEGGNVADDGFGPVGMSSLHLLTTSNQPLGRQFTTFNATSAAAALASKMAAEIVARYPSLRPETVRGLLVHSAEWTEEMKAMYLPRNGTATKKQMVNLIRHCGWGVPNLQRALWSAGNSLTLLIEDELLPYKRDKGKPVSSRDMNLHELAWPREELELLQDAKVEMRVTLSYFVEPNPSARGLGSKYCYPSHRLRFDVQRPLDASTADLVARVNAAAASEDHGDNGNPSDPNWCLGELQRHRGSLHQDIWTGTAAELASRGFIAVYPASGWWRTRQALERYDRPARYSLLVSIKTPETEIDLYNAIAQKIAIVT